MNPIARIAGAMLTALTRGRVLVRGRPGTRCLYLTFDDGPNEQHTPAILDLLDRHAVKATFFIVGREAQSRPLLVRRLVASGHELGNHTMIHPRMDLLSDRGRDIEIDGMECLLERFDGRRSHLFRPPYGGVSLSLLPPRPANRRRGAFLSRANRDYNGELRRGNDSFVRRAPQAGDILLFHDDGAVALAALGELLPRWLAEGFTFRTLREA